MNSKPSRRKCRNCRKVFSLDCRNRYHQYYCSEPACQHISKAASQRRWLRRAPNRDYFRGPEQTHRVQQWRNAHPGYWKRSLLASQSSQIPASQSSVSEKTSCNAPSRLPGALQDFCLAQDPVFVGLLSVVTDSTLQEDIAATIGDLLLRGRKLLGLGLPDQRNPKTHPDNDCRTSPSTGSTAAKPQQLQLCHLEKTGCHDDGFRQLFLPGLTPYD